MAEPATAAATPPAPRANPELIGHSDAETALLDAHRAGRLAHAWMITGPSGVGKATLAYRFARYLLAGGSGGLFADAAPSLAVDPTAPAFRRVTAGSHADLLVIERAYDDKRKRRRDQIVVDDVRKVGPFMHHSASEGGWRVVVVDAADDMNASAANALLKLLEEPPDKAIFLVVAQAPGRLLPTIRSRCRRIPLRPLADDVVESFVARYRPSLKADEIGALARLAGGSPGRALSLADEGGLDLYGELVTLLEQSPDFDLDALYGLAGRAGRADGEATFRTLMTLLSQWLARMIRCIATGDELAEVVAGEAAVMRRLMARRNLEQWTEVWDKIGRLAADAERVNLDRKQVVLTAFTALDGAS